MIYSEGEVCVDALGQAIELADEPVMVMDPQLRVLLWNSAAERQLRYRRSDTVGAPCMGAIRSPDCIGGCPILRGELEGTTSVYRRDGSLGWFRRSGRVVRGRDGDAIAIIERLSPSAPDRDAAEAAFHGLGTRSAAMRRAVDYARAVARIPVHVLVTGETGTGKRLVAAGIHTESGTTGPVASVACDTEEPRAWGDIVERARGGTLLLDQVQELPRAAQRALSRAWPEPGVTRIVATARPDLDDRVADGSFDRGLYHRLRQVTVEVPPLRARLDDVLPLSEHFLARWSALGDRPARRVSAEASAALRRYQWPGNVRELAAAIAHAYALGAGSEITPQDLPESIRAAAGPAPGDGGRDELLLERVRWALTRSGGRVSEAADQLGLSRSSFWRLRRRLGV